MSNELEHTRREARTEKEEGRCRTEELETRLGDLREKVMASEVSYSGRIKAGEQRERELQERVRQLSEEMEMLRIRAEAREQEWQTRLEMVQKETETVVLLRSQSMSDEGSSSLVVPPANPSYRHSSPMKQTTTASDNWHVEAESLRSVLDLKMNELSELRRQNQDLRRAADELTLQQIRTSSLESKVEELQFQLNARIERER